FVFLVADPLIQFADFGRRFRFGIGIERTRLLVAPEEEIVVLLLGLLTFRPQLFQVGASRSHALSPDSVGVALVGRCRRHRVVPTRGVGTLWNVFVDSLVSS